MWEAALDAVDDRGGRLGDGHRVSDETGQGFTDVVDVLLGEHLGVGLEGCRPLAQLVGEHPERVEAAADKRDLCAAGVGLASDLGTQSARGAGNEHDSAIQIEPRPAAKESAEQGQRTEQLRPTTGEAVQGVVDDGIHSARLAPRGTSTVRYRPGVCDMTIWSVTP